MKPQSYRKYHYYLSCYAALPALVVLVSGVLLLCRHYSSTIQPKKPHGLSGVLSLNYNDIERIVSKNFSDQKINKIVMRPKNGLVEVFMGGLLYAQLDGNSGDVIYSGNRYTSLLIQIHEGVFFSSIVRDFVFFPTGIILVLLWITGMQMVCVRWYVKIKKRKLLTRHLSL